MTDVASVFDFDRRQRFPKLGFQDENHENNFKTLLGFLSFVKHQFLQVTQTSIILFLFYKTREVYIRLQLINFTEGF